jgi:dTDP-4-amino-4,6-dideoxygalactose transaminase
VALNSADNDKGKQKAVELLSKYTRHRHVKLVHRGNAAILCALYIAKKVNPKPFILVPDQGGWISFRTYPQMLGFEVKTVQTNRGIIDLIDLEKKAESGAALLVTSFAGYFAEQPMKYISGICRKHGCLVIEDASGAVGDEVLCDGRLSDMVVGSFGKWKPINVEYGGFVSVADKSYFEDANEIFSSTNFYPKYDVLLDKLGSAPKRLKEMLKQAEDTKKELSARMPDIKIIHSELRGLNVVVRHQSENEKKVVIDYCKAKCYEYVECPQYIRLEEPAISIELKRN